MPEVPLSETETEASEEAPPKKGKKKLLLLLLIVVVLLGGGGGGGYYYWRVMAQAKQAAPKDKKAGEKDSADSDEGEVKQVIELQPFIVNLADKNEARYLRLTVSLGIGEGGGEKVDPLFTTKVRNAILAIITNKTSEEVLTVEGKAALRKEMLEAARRAVNKPEVHAIYITDFIIQM